MIIECPPCDALDAINNQNGFMCWIKATERHKNKIDAECSKLSDMFTNKLFLKLDQDTFRYLSTKFKIPYCGCIFRVSHGYGIWSDLRPSKITIRKQMELCEDLVLTEIITEINPFFVNTMTRFQFSPLLNYVINLSRQPNPQMKGIQNLSMTNFDGESKARSTIKNKFNLQRTQFRLPKLDSTQQLQGKFKKVFSKNKFPTVKVKSKPIITLKKQKDFVEKQIVTAEQRRVANKLSKYMSDSSESLKILGRSDSVGSFKETKLILKSTEDLYKNIPQGFPEISLNPKETNNWTSTNEIRFKYLQ